MPWSPGCFRLSLAISPASFGSIIRPHNAKSRSRARMICSTSRLCKIVFGQPVELTTMSAPAIA
jgi:hypothetical protein